jgi:hypothetical protein
MSPPPWAHFQTWVLVQSQIVWKMAMDPNWAPDRVNDGDTDEELSKSMSSEVAHTMNNGWGSRRPPHKQI